MEQAGYTYEERTNHPHRGSSVPRTVEDLFDTNVHLSLRPVELVPKELWNHVVPRTGSSSSNNNNNNNSTAALASKTDDTTEETGNRLPQLLIAALAKPKDRHRNGSADVDRRRDTSMAATRKRVRPSVPPLSFRDMVPVSLTIPYPEWYLQKRVEYVHFVKERELAIIEWQEAQEEIEMAGEEYVGSDGDVGAVTSNRSSYINPIVIPPIPQPPDPPQWNELSHPFGLSTCSNDDDDDVPLDPGNDTYETHPYYLPKFHEHLVEHLDPHCFHITDGRYFGLTTNRIADPNFIGPNAPGLSGSSTNTGGLATATTATTTSTSGLTGGGMTMILSASYHSAAAVAPASLKDEYSQCAVTLVKAVPAETDAVPMPSKSSLTVKVVESPKPPKKAVTLSPTDLTTNVETKETRGTHSSMTRTMADLRTIMEGDDERLMETFREYIVRSIVYTHRTHKSMNVPFRGPDHETYPDIGKAFAWFGGIKPCDRCKSNKQGVRTHVAFSSYHYKCFLQMICYADRHGFFFLFLYDRYCIVVSVDAMMIPTMMVVTRSNHCFWDCWTHRSIPS